MKEFFQKIPEFIGMFLLKGLLLVGALICFGAGVFLSWEHTTEFALENGLPEGLALAYTILVEVLLCMCEIALIFLILMGKKTNLSIKVGLGFGLTINMTSNILSLWEFGFLGIAIGVSIPVGSAISAWVFASALVKEVKKSAQQKQAKQAEEFAALIQETNLQQVEQSTKKADENLNENKPLQAKKTINELIVLDEEKKSEENHTDFTEIKPEQSIKVDEKNVPESIEKAPEKKAEKDQLKKAEKPKRGKSSKPQKSGRKQKRKKPVDFEAILSKASEIKKEKNLSTKEFKKEIQNAMDCTPYYAEKAITELEKNEAEEQPKLAIAQ